MVEVLGRVVVVAQRKTSLTKALEVLSRHLLALFRIDCHGCRDRLSAHSYSIVDAYMPSDSNASLVDVLFSPEVAHVGRAPSLICGKSLLLLE
jgi:hypothetical protein